MWVRVSINGLVLEVSDFEANSNSNAALHWQAKDDSGNCDKQFF